MDRKNLILIIFVIVGVFLVYAFGGFGNEPMLAPFNASVTITNQPPVVLEVYPEDPIIGTAGQTTNTVVTFIVEDPNGAGDIVVASASAQYTGAGGSPVNNPVALCSSQACSTCTSNQINVSCTVPFDYYDEPETYAINATIDDVSGSTGSNASESADYNSIIAITNDDDVLSWTNIDVSPTAFNQTPSDSLTIRNQGNTVRNDLLVTAYDLYGNTLGSGDADENITAQSFTASGNNGPSCPGSCGQCAGLAILPLQHGVARPLVGESVPFGPPGASQEEELYFCIPNSLDSLGLGDLAGYSVSATGGQQWEVCVGC